MEYKLVFPRDQSGDQTMYYVVDDAFTTEELEWIDNLQNNISFMYFPIYLYITLK